MTNPWTTLTRGDRDFDRDITKRSVIGAREHLTGPKTLMTKIGQIVTTDRPYYSERIDGIIGGFEETAEGTQEAPPMSPITVADIKLRVKYYTAALVLSKNRVEDDGLGLVQKLAPKITERAIERQEIDFQNMVLNTPTVFNAQRDQRDGVPLASASHPTGPYGALSGNVAGTPSALTESSLATAVTSFASIIDDNGDPAPTMPKKFLLIVHPSRVLYAQQLTKSLSSTADQKNSGVINPVSSANGLSFEVWPAYYQTSVTAWMLVAVDDDGTGLLIVQRKPPTAPKKIIRENPEQAQWFSEMRYGMGVSDWRKIYYNAGL
jgi:hypothetical protein